MTRDNPADADPFGGSVVVSDRDLDNVVLSEISLAPSRVWQGSPRSAEKHPVGNVPLPQISGKVVDEASHQPVREGEIVVKGNGYYTASFPIDAKGHFEIPALLPGTYELEVQAFGHTSVKRSVEIDDEDGNVEFAVRRILN